MGALSGRSLVSDIFERMQPDWQQTVSGVSAVRRSGSQFYERRRFIAKHRLMPIKVGSRKAVSVQNQLPVSLRMVRQVVEQGQ